MFQSRVPLSRTQLGPQCRGFGKMGRTISLPHLIIHILEAVLNFNLNLLKRDSLYTGTDCISDASISIHMSILHTTSPAFQTGKLQKRAVRASPTPA